MSDRHPETVRTETVVERATVPFDGILFGYGAMVPFVLCVAGVWFGGPRIAALSLSVTILWGAAILIFLAGVRRGLSFRTPGGPRGAQIGMMLWLFLAGIAAPLLPVAWALGVLVLGYASLFALDPVAARHDEAPLYFARLRPPQMAIPIVCLLAIAGARLA